MGRVPVAAAVTAVAVLVGEADRIAVVARQRILRRPIGTIQRIRVSEEWASMRERRGSMSDVICGIELQLNEADHQAAAATHLGG